MNFSYAVSQSENKITIEAEYAFTSNMYAAKEYMSLKVIMNEIIKVFNEMIVLVKE